MNRYMLPLVAVIIGLAYLWIALYNDPSKLPSQFLGKPAPQFDLPTLRDPAKRIRTADLSGQVSLVNIWATWCVGCRAEHEFLMQLYNNKTIPIYAINWRDDRGDALAWLGQLGDPYVASGFDEDARVGIDWGVYGAPETFLIDAQGNVVYRFTGPLNQVAWNEQFVPRIAELSK